MTIDELLSDIGITPGDWKPVYIDETMVGSGNPIRIHAYLNNMKDARLIAASREMLKALIKAREDAYNTEWNALYAHGWTDEECDIRSARVTRYMTYAIESATGLRWDQIKEKLDE